MIFGARIDDFCDIILFNTTMSADNFKQVLASKIRSKHAGAPTPLSIGLFLEVVQGTIEVRPEGWATAALMIKAERANVVVKYAFRPEGWEGEVAAEKKAEWEEKERGAEELARVLSEREAADEKEKEEQEADRERVQRLAVLLEESLLGVKHAAESHSERNEREARNAARVWEEKAAADVKEQESRERDRKHVERLVGVLEESLQAVKLAADAQMEAASSSRIACVMM